MSDQSSFFPSLPANPFRGTITDSALTAWLEQFTPEEHELVRKLVANFRFYDPGRVNEGLRRLHQRVLEVLRRPVEKIWFIPVGYVAKSGSVIAYFYKTQNDIPQERFILANDLANVRLTADSAVVFLDDYIGSGHQGRQVWDTVLSLNASGASLCPFVFAAIVGTETGIAHLASTTNFRVLTVDTLDEAAIPLHEQSRVFPDPAERNRAKEVLERYGADLYPDGPLGYANSQGLLGFFYSTPNNTLPIFWSTVNGWKPLLPHKESYRDPAFLVGPPSGLTAEDNLTGPERPLRESAKLDEYDLSAEVAIKLLTEFQRLDIVLALAPAIRALNLDATIAPLLKLMVELRHLRHEKEGVCTSLLIVPDDAATDAIGTLFVSASAGLTIGAHRELTQLAQLIRGFDGGVVVKAGGDVLGDATFRRTTTTSYPLLPERYHRAARASLDSRGLLFVFPGDDRATVFYRGNRILTYRGASWHLQPAELQSGIAKLASSHGVHGSALQNVFRLALQLSDEGHGALLTIGDHEAVLSLSDKPKTGHFQWTSLHVQDSDPDALLGLIRQDGATIISSEGRVVQGMTFLRPPAGARGVEEVGKGSKHSTAAKVSGSTKCISVAVSVDGQITVFSDGAILFKLMG